MRQDVLPETWPEKFANYTAGVEYVYRYHFPEQLESARNAVELANKSKKASLTLNYGRTKFSIKKQPPVNNSNS